MKERTNERETLNTLKNILYIKLCKITLNSWRCYCSKTNHTWKM